MSYSCARWDSPNQQFLLSTFNRYALTYVAIVDASAHHGIKYAGRHSVFSHHSDLRFMTPLTSCHYPGTRQRQPKTSNAKRKPSVLS